MRPVTRLDAFTRIYLALDRGEKAGPLSGDLLALLGSDALGTVQPIRLENDSFAIQVTVLTSVPSRSLEALAAHFGVLDEDEQIEPEDSRRSTKRKTRGAR